MNKLIAIICCTITLTACGNLDKRPIDPNGPNSDIRTIKGFQLMGGDVATAAARACDKENKKLEVITTTTQNSIMSDTVYPVIVFKCVDLEVQSKTKKMNKTTPNDSH